MALPLDYVWYVLADAAASVGAEAGVAQRLLSPAWDKRAVFTSELTFLVNIANSAQRRLCVEEYLARLPRALDARAYLETNAKTLMPIADSPRTRVPLSNSEDFEVQRKNFSRQILTFALRIAFCVSPDTATSFIDEANQLERPVVTNAMADTFKTGVVSTTGDDVALAGTVGAIVRSLADDEPLSATDLMIASLRLVELLASEYCEPDVITKSVDWTLRQWKHAVKIQAFQFSSPRLAEHAVADIDRSQSNRVKDIADLILAMAPYIRVNIGEDYKVWLRQISAVKAP